MATTTKTKTRTKARRKPAAKAAGSPRVTRTTKRSKASKAKVSRTRAVHQTEAAVKQAQTAGRYDAQVLGDYAERAVLIPVGAALIARDRVVSGVSDTISTVSSTTKAQQQLRKFERRGVTARKRLEREVRKTRVRVERELRQRRREITKTVGEIEDRRDAITKNGSDLANQVQERILSLV
jgi:O-phosphoseryl-tRNA(Sec) selenium transferase, SepSecS